MTTTTTTTAPLTIWLTDRSRVKTGTARCPRARYLGYHAGPGGYGFAARHDSLPLATGISVHRGLEGFTRHLATRDQIPTSAEARLVIAGVVKDYVTRVEERGFRGILSSADTEETIVEQATLIEGLLWAVYTRFLPWFHAQYQALVVEEERLHFLSCACGAPPLDTAEHVRRGCCGQALMLRTDLLARRRTSGTLSYFEAKTTGWDSDSWAEQWETDPQLALGTLDAETRWGGEVTELYILGLRKGRRTRNRHEPEERKMQQSVLCYGYCRPANPPLTSDDWLPSYEWTTDDGTIKRKTKAHVRRGIWELGESDWPAYRAYHGQDPSLSPSEFWVRTLPKSVMDKVCFLVGPMNRQDAQLQMTLRGMAGEEHRWQDNLWALYEAQLDGLDWPSPEFQALLDRLVPCSWNCRPFGRDHECEFVPVCHRHVGWEDPIGSGHYQPRLPHHDPELQQAIARGLLPEEAAEAAEEDE